MTSTPAEGIAPVVDLTLLDVTAQDLFEQGLADALSKLPDWTPREGHTEVVLLETLALLGAETVYAVNRLPRALLADLLAAYGLTIDPGAAPTASATFTTSAVDDVAIPAGTLLRLPYGDELAVEFTTDAALTITGGTYTGTVAITATTPTAAVNGTPADTAVELVDAVAAVDTVTLGAPVTGGVDPEDVDAFLNRGALRLRRLVSTLVLPEHFTAAALETPGVARADTVDLYNPDAGSGAPGDHPGHVTTAVTGPGGAPLSTDARASIEADLEGKAHAALDVHVVDATITAVDVTATITVTAGQDPTLITAAATAAVEDYLNPDAWPFAGTVYRNELIALLDRVPGVDRVVDLTAPAADVTLTGIAPLAAAGAVTITV